MGRTPGANKKKPPANSGAGRGNTVPDKPTIVSLHDLSPDENRKTFGESAAVVRKNLSTAMEPQALVWFSNNTTVMVNALSFDAGRDKTKINQLAKMCKNLLTAGWTNKAWGGVTQWMYKRGEVALGPAKAEKAIKPAQALATSFFALADAIAAKDAEDLGRGGDNEDNIPDEFPRRGAREDDGLPFEHGAGQAFENFLEEDTEVPGFVADIDNNFLRAEPRLDQRATDFERGLAQPADHRLATGSLQGFKPTFNGRTHDISEARVLQEDVVTGAMYSIKVGAPKTQLGLLQMYNDELDRLVGIRSSRNKFAYFSTAHVVTLRGFRLTFTSV
jgi:hypothetical protein